MTGPVPAGRPPRQGHARHARPISDAPRTTTAVRQRRRRPARPGRTRPGLAPPTPRPPTTTPRKAPPPPAQPPARPGEGQKDHPRTRHRTARRSRPRLPQDAGLLQRDGPRTTRLDWPSNSTPIQAPKARVEGKDSPREAGECGNGWGAVIPRRLRGSVGFSRTSPRRVRLLALYRCREDRRRLARSCLRS